MKVTYWIAAITTDSSVYNVRAKTKGECQRRLDERNECNAYCAPHKVTAEYRDGFDLLDMALGEGGAWWEDDCDKHGKGSDTHDGTDL